MSRRSRIRRTTIETSRGRERKFEEKGIKDMGKDNKKRKEKEN